MTGHQPKFKLCFRLAFWPNVHEPVSIYANTPDEVVKELYRRFPEGFKLKFFDVGTTDPVVVCPEHGVHIPVSVIKAGARFFALILSGWNGEGDPPKDEDLPLPRTDSDEDE